MTASAPHSARAGIPDTLDALAVPIDSLKPYGRNPRQGDVGAIIASLERHGQYRPIVVNSRTQEVLAGNHTLKAAIELGWTEIAATFVDADEDQAARIVLVDNRSNDLAAYDDSALIDLLRELPDFEGTGFDGDDLDALLADLDGPPAGAGSDTEPEDPPADPKTSLGDLILLGDHRLLCGDSTDAAAVALLMDGDESTLLFTSPPYADAREYGGGDLDVGQLASFLAVWSADLLCVNLGIIRRENEIVTYWDEYITAARESGLKLLSWNIWDRGQPWSMAQNTAMFPIEHEWVFVFGDRRRDLNLTVPNKSPGTRTGITNRQKDGSLKAAAPKEVRLRRPLGTLFRSPPHIGKDIGHPAMFPIAFPEAYIGAATDAGEIVCEPFGGAGTTIIAAENLGRRCYAMELDPGYCDVIVDRWERHTGKTAELQHAA